MLQSSKFHRTQRKSKKGRIPLILWDKNGLTLQEGFSELHNVLLHNKSGMSIKKVTFVKKIILKYTAILIINNHTANSGNLEVELNKEMV